MNREDLIRAVVQELERRGDKALSDSLATAESIADALGLRSFDASLSGLEGAGIWIRLGSRPDPDIIAQHLRFVVIPLHTGRKGMVVMGPSLRKWIQDLRDAQVSIWGMDWLPKPESVAHVGALCDLARDLGFRGIMADCEPDVGWRGAKKEAIRYRDVLAKHRGALDLAITDYARGGIGDSTLKELLSERDGHRPVGVPQSYDPQGTYDPEYHIRSVRYWRKMGAQRIVLGVGLWLAGEKRHRTVSELERHLENIPAGVQGICGWYASARTVVRSGLLACLGSVL